MTRVPNQAKKTVILVATEDWFLALHWLPLIRAAMAAGWHVIVATRVRQDGEALRATGAELVPLSLAREGRNPWSELRAVDELTALYRSRRPDVVHHIAMKPILYGAWAAQRAEVPRVIHTFPGLGHLYVGTSWRRRMARQFVELLLTAFFRRPQVVVQVQNQTDATELIEHGVVAPSQMQDIGGVGVDLAVFTAHPDVTTARPMAILPARMLVDKGVLDFVAAAKLLRAQGSLARFVLVGDTDPANPAAVPAAQLHAWAAEGIVEWLGQRDDIPQLLAEANLVVLPSFYREGVPKSLQEAAATGRAIITTDVPGCRDVVRHGWNGLIVPPRDPVALAGAMDLLLRDPAQRAMMGRNGRQLAEEIFDDREQAAGMISRYALEA